MTPPTGLRVIAPGMGLGRHRPVEALSAAMTFPDLLTAANSGKHPRASGQWTPTACQVWREAGPEASRLLEAALAWELSATLWCMEADEHRFLPGSLILRRRGRIPGVRGRAFG